MSEEIAAIAIGPGADALQVGTCLTQFGKPPTHRNRPPSFGNCSTACDKPAVRV